MKDVFHQVLFLFIAFLVITGLRLLLGDYIRFLGATSIVLYLVLDGILLIAVGTLYLLSRQHK